MKRGIALACAALALFAGRRLLAQGGAWTPEQRVLISDFSRVGALAADAADVFVATRNGLGIYDHRFNSWELPIGTLRGYPANQVITAAIADPTDQSVWIGTARGLIHYRPTARDFETVMIPGGVRDLMFDANDPFSQLYVLTTSGWQYLPRGSGVTVPAMRLPRHRIRPLGVNAFLRRAPVADAMSANVLLDERLRNFHYTAVAEVPHTNVYYLGTDGMGIIKFDRDIVRFERLPFGLLDKSVGAVVAVRNGVWVGTGFLAFRHGITFASDDLRRYEYDEGPRAIGLGITGIRALVAHGREVWAATNMGIEELDPGNPDFVRRIGMKEGLPDRQVYALATSSAGVWAGTALGLVRIDKDGKVNRSHMRETPVLAVTAAGDSAWFGTTVGLGLAIGDSMVMPAEVNANPDLRGTIVALSRTADTVVAATVDRIVWHAPGKAWQSEPPLAELGTITCLAGDTHGVWIGGLAGVAFFTYSTRAFRVFHAPIDVPLHVRGIAVDQKYVWVGTDNGLVRFEKRAMGLAF